MFSCGGGGEEEEEEQKIADGPDTRIQCCFRQKSVRFKLNGDLNLALVLEGLDPVMLW